MEELTVELRDNHIIVRVPRSFAGAGLEGRTDAQAIVDAVRDAVAALVTPKAKTSKPA